MAGEMTDVQKLTQALAGKNFATHTRVYVNDVLRVDTAVANLAGGTPVAGYQISRSRKLGAARLVLNVANPDGMYSYHKSSDPVFGHGNKIKVAEGVEVEGEIKWHTRFTGIIVSQVAANQGGRPSLKVCALDNTKLLLDYLPEELEFRPRAVKVTGEVLVPVPSDDGSPYYTHYKGSPAHLPWIDIPNPVFYKNGTKIKENYEVDLISGEVYFGAKMWTPQWVPAAKIADLHYRASVMLPSQALVRRSFALIRYDAAGKSVRHEFPECELPAGVTATCSGSEIWFSGDPFGDLNTGPDWVYAEKKIRVSTEAGNQITADYWYYDAGTNLAEDVIRQLALKAGFKPEQIILDSTAVDGVPISLKPLRFTALTVRNGFEALQKIKQQLPPHYIITCDREGNLRGYYAAQQPAEDYPLELIKRIEAPVSEEGLYSAVIAHGVDLNPNDLGKKAAGQSLLANWQNGNFSLAVSGSPSCLFNKNVDDQMWWQWRRKNDQTPPEFPFDLLAISLPEAKKIEEINILVGDYQGGTIQQSISVQISENGTDWFYIDKASRGLGGYSSQWVTAKGGELENRKIRFLKIIAEAGFEWAETHTWSEKGGWFMNPKISVHTDTYYNWYLAIKEVQIWEENTIAVTSTLGNCIGVGDGSLQSFFIPNLPVVSGSETVYVEGRQAALGSYAINYTTGEIKFHYPPTGLVTADYSVAAKTQSVYQPNREDRYGDNVTVINPPGTVAFTGGAIQPDSAEYKVLKKIGLKKVALKIDNYLNSFADVKKRGEEMLAELASLQETLDIDVVYRPDMDICQTVAVVENRLGLAANYFIEEVTETKQGYRPAANVKVSHYR